jgi:DNA uptake protein ComE-like DNA-binding protein
MTPAGRTIKRSSQARRAFATFLVLWAVALVSLILLAVQAFSFRQAAAGREAVARVRAHWAARAGIEAAITQIGYNTVEPDATSAKTITYDLEDAAYGALAGASFKVEHWADKQVYRGPADAHAKININTMDADALMTLPSMTEDTADAILDWIDTDEDVRPLGAEIGQYYNLRYPYQPRNDYVRSLPELELIAGVDPQEVRGEDWNLNGLLDPNENDGDLSWPPDNADDLLDAGWSRFITASSADGGLGASGYPRLNLTTAEPEDIVRRLGLDLQQATVIATYCAAGEAQMTDFISRDLATLTDPGTGERIDPTARSLTRAELGLLLDECSLDDAVSAGLYPGKLNIITCVAEALDYLPAVDPALADAIILARDGRAEGFTSLADLLDIPSITRARLAALFPLLTVRSNVFTITSRGRDETTGLEIEIIAVVDRSTLPVVIRDIRTP